MCLCALVLLKLAVCNAHFAANSHDDIYWKKREKAHNDNGQIV